MSVEEPYGKLITSTIGVLSWNLWGRFGPWEEREQLIVAAIEALDPDVIALQESWATDDGRVTQAECLAERLGYDHWFAGEPSLSFDDGWGPVSAVVSRWAITDPVQRSLQVSSEHRGWPGEVIECVIGGPRGDVPLVDVALDWPPQASALRQSAVNDLATRCKALDRGHDLPVVVCGDFNAGPDSAELRMLTGADEVTLPGFVLFDAWDKAGVGPGLTWDRANRWAMPALLPSRRIDFVLTGWPSLDGGRGDVISAQVVGRGAPGEMPPSDHYGVFVELRY